MARPTAELAVRRVLKAFPPLRGHDGHVLRAYRFRDGAGNGNGVVWATPASAPFPEPTELPVDEERFLSPPKPPEALDDFTAAIEGDNSPLSHGCASVLAGEARELGALWHGCGWSVERILSGVGRETILRNADRDRLGDYRFDTERIPLAHRPGGFVFVYPEERARNDELLAALLHEIGESELAAERRKRAAAALAQHGDGGGDGPA
jgi:hypothetical protein